MANEDWVKFRKKLLDDPRVLAIAEETNVHRHRVIGALLELWCWADTHTVDGYARGVTAVTLDDACDLLGFIVAVENVGWLRVTSRGIVLEDFESQNTQTAKRRALTARRMETYRKRKRNANGNASVTPQASPRTRTRVTTPPTPPGGDKCAPEEAQLPGLDWTDADLQAVIDAYPQKRRGPVMTARISAGRVLDAVAGKVGRARAVEGAVAAIQRYRQAQSMHKYLSEWAAEAVNFLPDTSKPVDQGGGHMSRDKAAANERARLLDLAFRVVWDQMHDDERSAAIDAVLPTIKSPDKAQRTRREPWRNRPLLDGLMAHLGIGEQEAT